MVSTVKGVFRVPMDGESEQPFVFSTGTPQAFDMFPHLSLNGRHSFSTLLLGGYELVWAHPAVSGDVDMEDGFIFRLLSLAMGCRWMAYHLEAHATSCAHGEKNQ